MNATRRALIGASALILPALALAGCTLTQSQIAAQVVTDAQAIVNGLTPFIPAIEKLANIPAGPAATIINDVQTAINAASSISATVTASSAASAATQVYNVISEAAKIGAPFLPPPYGMILSAVLALLPAVGQALGISLGAVGAAPGGLSPDGARAILANSTALLS